MSWKRTNIYLKVLVVLPLVAIAGVAASFYLQKNDSDQAVVANSQDTQAFDEARLANVQGIHSECEAKPSPGEIFECYETYFKLYMEKNGGRKTLELLQQLNDSGGYAKSNCHPLSHKVGNIALHVYGSVPNAVPEYIPTCHSGYYHGLLEEYLATAPSYEQGVSQVCGTTQTQPYFNWFQCTHGLGHGVMQFRNNELPDALKDCDIVDPADQAREICYAGAFMENITTDEKTGHPAKYIKKEDPIYPCNGKEIAEHYRSACYFLASSQILKINGYNMKDAFVQCGTVEDKYRWLCFQSLGRDVSGTNLRNKQLVIDQCQYAVNPTDTGECFFGAVRDFINEKGEFDGGIDLCLSIPNSYQGRCYDAIMVDLRLFKKGSEYSVICGKLPETYKNTCLSTQQS